MLKLKYIPVLLIIIFSVQVNGQTDQKYADLGNYKLENGQIIKNCRIGYRTYGKLNAEKSNALLFPTWFGGNSAGLVGLIGPGKMADSTKYFVIAVDALGDGVSSSPSNSELQKGKLFPRFNIMDMVNTQYELVTKVLGLKHLFCVIGGSMGGMQTFQWIVAYPDFMDKAIAWVGSPKLTSYDLLLWNTEKQIIESDLKNNVPEESIMESMADVTALNINTPEYRVTHTKPEEYDKFIAGYRKSFAKNFKPYNWLSQLNAMIAHDVSAPYGGDMEKAASRVKAKLLSIVNLQDHMVNPAPAIKFVKMIHAESLELNNDCGHLGPGCEMERVDKTINEFLNN